MSNLNQLNREMTALNRSLKDSILSGDYDRMTELEKSKAELSKRIEFAEIAAIREEISALEDERTFALELQRDFDAELKQQAQVVIEKRGELMNAETAYNVIKSRQYALENEIASKREAIRELKIKLASRIDSKIAEVTA